MQTMLVTTHAGRVRVTVQRIRTGWVADVPHVGRIGPVAFRHTAFHDGAALARRAGTFAASR